MGCKYSDLVTGECQLYCPDIEMPGCDENGICMCDDDPCPAKTCDQFETDGSDCDGDCENCPENEE